MADNTRGGSQDGSNPLIATDEVTHSGDTADVQLMRPVHVTGSEGSKTVADITDANGQFVQGSVAHDSPDAGAPIKIGGYGADSAPSSVTAGDRVNAWLTRDGRQVVTIAGTGGVAGTTNIDGDDKAGTIGANVWSMNGMFDGSTWDRMRSAEAYKTAAATVLEPLAVISVDRRYTSVALGTVVSNTQSWDTMGANTVLVHVGSSQTGTFIFEVSADGSNWVAANTWDANADTWVTNQNLTPTANKVYRLHTAGWRSLRARTVTTLNGTVALTATLAEHSPIVLPMATPPPHAIGYAITGKTAQYTSSQTGTAVWTPASGKKLVITSYQLQAGGTTAGTVQLWFGASGDTTYNRGTDLAIFDGEFAPSTTLKPGVVQTGVWVASAVDHVLRFTDSAAINPITVTAWGYEV